MIKFQTARQALVLAFNYSKRQPGSQLGGKPKKELIKPKVRRIKRDRKTPFMDIVEIPGPLTEGKGSRSGKRDNTTQISNMTLIGHILSAAESKSLPGFTRDWLRFAYDDDCPRDVKLRVHAALCREFCHLENRTRRMHMTWEAMIKYKDLASIVMIDTRNAVQENGRAFSWADKCAAIGASGGDRKNWGQSWAPHEGDMMRILLNADAVGVAKVNRVIDLINIDLDEIELLLAN